MKIRSITGFFDPGWPFDPQAFKAISKCLHDCRKKLISAGYDVQTMRVATPPPAEMSNPIQPGSRVELASNLEAEAFVHEIDYAAVGPALPHDLDGFLTIPDMLAATQNVFTSAIYADPESGLSLSAARACAEVIHKVSSISPDGFTNLRFAALVNVPAGVPFFPAAYHRTGTPSLAIATEAADLAITATQDAASVADIRNRLVQGIEDQATTVAQITDRICREHAVRFLGVDFSLAPYPEDLRSIGTAIEAIGPPKMGQPGSLSAIAFLADCLDEALFMRTGFCGLFLPVLEDTILAKRAAEGHLSVYDLLLYSTVCGTGLDTIPLAGDVTPGTIATLLIDLGALGLRHHKPLTARLLPIPGKKAGDDVHFDFPYFSDCKVMDLYAEPLSGVLGGDETIDIGPHTH